LSIFTNPISAAAGEADAYIAAVLGLLDEQDPYAVLNATPGLVRRFVTSRSAEQLRQPERSGKWCMLEVLQHLADSELVWAYRMRLVVSEDRPVITGYDQDRWSESLGYRAVDPSHAVEQFDVLRRLNLGLFRTLPAEAFARVGIHSERGAESLDHMVRLYAGHDLVHLRQLNRIHESG
jgi:hypothetical protein